ncbi:hypothetical protein BJ878DRAFT_485037 [Calycina marina]|uniref:Letm1 RBD domain-containing protein n=1 Tax=Calycina marina TaxID=1763456 RepID=A0A9P7ZCT9_9HELO|nr:hypothetical protein BJ878DRAFT_485037 [Calycina marina]
MSSFTLCISKRTIFQHTRSQLLQFKPNPIRKASTATQKKKHSQSLKRIKKPLLKSTAQVAQLKPQARQAQTSATPKSTAIDTRPVTKHIATHTTAIAEAPVGAIPSPLHVSETKEHIVNGPSTTRPPPINTPERARGQAFFFKYAFALGKSYVEFYKTGVKYIYANLKTTRKLQARLKASYKGDIERAIADGAINRREFQLIHRNRHDLKRVPVFALVMTICGEFTPIVVLAFGNVVPWACRIPQQIDKSRRKLEKRRAISFARLDHPSDGMPESVEELERKELLHINWSLGLSSAVWDWIFPGQLPGLPTFLVRNAVRKRVEYLEMDDTLILRSGGVGEMHEDEVKMACVERGINVMGLELVESKKALGVWLDRQKKTSVETLLLLEPGKRYQMLDGYGGLDT